MLIGITQRNDCNRYGDYVDSLENSYLDYLTRFGISVVVLPNSLAQVNSYLETFCFHGFILSGGNDINPQQLGNSSINGLSISEKRDQVESAILKFAIDRKVPVLGICRGMQFINAHFGGDIQFNINSSASSSEALVGRRIFHAPTFGNSSEHLVILDKDLCGRDEALVNSYHNHGLKKEDISKELNIFAQSPDGVIEGIYHPNYPIAGIQWHPERKSPDEIFNAQLINGFIERGLFWREK